MTGEASGAFTRKEKPVQINRASVRTGVVPKNVFLDHVNALGLYWPLSVTALAIGSILLWLPAIGLPLHVDAAGYAVAARWWARGDRLYQDITITRPQGIFVVFRLIEALGLGSPRGIHLFAASYCTVSALTLLAVTSRVWGRGIGLTAAGLFALLMATPVLEGYSANAELFMLLPLLASLWVLLQTDDLILGSRLMGWLLFICGVLGALALLLKPAGVAAPALAALWLARRWRLEHSSWRAWVRAEILLALGFLGGLLPALAHGLLTAPDRYLDAILFNRLTQDSAASAGLGYQLTHFVVISLFIIMRLPILLIALVGLGLGRHQGDRRGRDFLWLWTVTSLGGAALGGSWIPHYYQQLVPPLAIATALGLRATLKYPQGMRRTRRVALMTLQGTALCGILSLGMTFATIFTAPADPQKLTVKYDSFHIAEPDVIRDIATYLRERTAPNDQIYVAYDHADIYHLADRRPAARWLYWRELAFTPGAFDEQVAYVADPATGPRYIVAAQSFDLFGLDPHGALRAVVARDYVLETTIGGIPLYRRLERPASPAARE